MTSPTTKPSIDSIGADIQELRRRTDKALRRAGDRSLPFADALFDRWERAATLGFGAGTSVYDSAAIFGNVVESSSILRESLQTVRSNRE